MSENNTFIPGCERTKKVLKRVEDEWNGIKKQIEEEPLDLYCYVKRCGTEQHQVIRPSVENMV